MEHIAFLKKLSPYLLQCVFVFQNLLSTISSHHNLFTSLSPHATISSGHYVLTSLSPHVMISSQGSDSLSLHSDCQRVLKL